MAEEMLSNIYRDYIACLNEQEWANLGAFVADDVHHNGRRLGLSGYREMLERDFDAIPDLHFEIQLLIADSQNVASRLGFHCTPMGGARAAGERQESALHRECFLHFRERKDRSGMVDCR